MARDAIRNAGRGVDHRPAPPYPAAGGSLWLGGPRVRAITQVRACSERSSSWRIMSSVRWRITDFADVRRPLSAPGRICLGWDPRRERGVPTQRECPRCECDESVARR